MVLENDSKKGKKLAAGGSDMKFAESAYDQRPFVCKSIVSVTVRLHNRGLQR